MQVQVETLSPVIKKINFEIPVEQVNAEIEKHTKAFRNEPKFKVSVPAKPLCS